MVWFHHLCSDYGHCFGWGMLAGIALVAILHASPLHG